MLPQRLIAIDWSGRTDAAGQRRHIWAGVWTAREGRQPHVALEAGRTREEVGDWLIALAAETPQMVVSIDCCFSFPAWFLAEHGCATVFAFWQKAAEGLAEQWLAGECEDVARDERFWGKPHKRPEQFCGVGYRRMFRGTDWDNKVDPVTSKTQAAREVRLAKMRGITPKSPFQIGGSGSVGTGSLRAMPFLLCLHNAGFRTWPFESAAANKPLLVEMYTRLMTGPVAKSNAEARRAYLMQRRKEDPLFRDIPASVRRVAESSEDAFDALISMVEMLRHREEFSSLRATRDPELKLEGITWRPGMRG